MSVFVRRRWWVIIVLMGALCALLIGLRYMHADSQHSDDSGKSTGKSKNQSKAKSTRVRVALSQQQDVDLWRDIPATVTPLQQVVIRPQVSGQVTRLWLREGQTVQRGQPLVQLDDRAIRAEIDSLHAAAQRIAAERQAVQRNLGRYQALIADQAVSGQELDQLSSQVRQLDAQYAAAQADIRVKRVALSQTLIHAPFSGRVGLRQVAVGAQVSSNDTQGVVTLTQTQPIAVNFGLPETLLAQGSGLGLAVEVWSLDQAVRLASSQVSIQDASIDANTGNLTVRAVLPNPQEQLLPNQSVRVRVRLKQLKQVITVPLTAFQQGLHDQFVMVVRQGRVKRTPVTVLAQTDTLMVLSGVPAGEQVVVDGLLRLKDGAQVSVQRDESDKQSDKQSAASSANKQSAEMQPADKQPTDKQPADQPPLVKAERPS